MEIPPYCPSEYDFIRFEKRVVRVPNISDCWIWTGARLKREREYGRFNINNKMFIAHRVAYTWWHGPIPEDFDVHHTCNYPPCVNPDHLEAVTRHENLMVSEGITAKNARKTHCPRGHEYSVGKQGRICLICKRDSLRQSRARRRQTS